MGYFLNFLLFIYMSVVLKGFYPLFSSINFNILFRLTAVIVVAPCICMPNIPAAIAFLYPCLCFNSPFFASILYRSLDNNLNSSVSWKAFRSEEHTSELQSRGHLVCRLLLEKKQATVRL